jgi:hypothetical protein
MRWYGYPALISLIVCQYLMFKKVEPVFTFFTPLQWWAYIFLADAIVYGRQKKSLISDRPVEFLIMLVLSNVCWLIFEWYNFLLHNWYYINLSSEQWMRLLGYSTSFASIFPVIFITADLLESFGLFRDRNPKPRKLSNGFLAGSLLGGAACVVFPLAFPSPYIFGLVWIGFFFLLEPVNYWLKASSIFEDWEQGKWQRFWLLLAAGVICGGLWEFWNFWANAKWIYTVPFTKNLKYFEMPLLGILGFPPFALECFSMYHFMRWLLSTKTQGTRREIVTS